MKERCVIVGAGDFYEESLPIEKDDLVIAADGGYLNCQKVNVRPQLLVADFDSLIEKVEGIETVVSVPEKDDTDMLLAIQQGLKRGCDEFVIYGGMGGRLEHTLANIQCLNQLAHLKIEAVMKSKNSSVYVIYEDQIEFDEAMKGYISVFALEDATVSISNLKYELDHYQMKTTYPIGTDNEFIGKKSRIHVHSGAVCIIVSEG